MAETVKELGTATFGVGLLGLAWELAARRAFMDEVLATVAVADDVAEQGLTLVTLEYLKDVEWRALFEDTGKLDLFVSYAQTWTNTYSVELQQMAGKGVKMRVLLPDPGDGRVMEELAIRYNTNAADIAQRVRTAASRYSEFGAAAGANVLVRFTKFCPLFTSYLFSKKCVFAAYSHRQTRGGVPTFMATAAKPLYDFFQAEFDHLWGIGTGPGLPANVVPVDASTPQSQTP